MNASYILPIRLTEECAIDELARYLSSLTGVELIVVDASDESLFAALDRRIGGVARHVRPNGSGLNGKARGLLTGLALASHEKVIVADDDVRYDACTLSGVLQRLDEAEVVRPQNYFTPSPWHATLDAARSLINRAFDGDWPGTIAFRRSALPKGYNPNVLFENFELVRTIRLRGHREIVARDLFIARRPPSTQHFFGQRVRQAYDELARPTRIVAALLALPALCALAWVAGSWTIAAFASATIGCAALGWCRDGAYRYFSVGSVFAAPLWALERAVCSWIALYHRVRYGGIRYGDSLISMAASPSQELLKWIS